MAAHTCNFLILHNFFIKPISFRRLVGLFEGVEEQFGKFEACIASILRQCLSSSLLFTCISLNWQVKSPRGRSCTDQHSQSLDDIRLYKHRHPPLSATLSSDTSHSYTFGCSLEDKLSVYGCVYSTADCKTKSALYGKRSMNCLSLDLLGEDQLPEEFVV